LGGDSVAERQALAPAEIVVGEAADDADARGGAAFADGGRLAGDEIIVGDEESVGSDPVAGEVVFVRGGAAETDLLRAAAGASLS
jgi:hypothetical protein